MKVYLSNDNHFLDLSRGHVGDVCHGQSLVVHKDLCAYHRGSVIFEHENLKIIDIVF